ncbi:hybrid sensor histidine kinase/response regulator [Pseudoduganella lutea]|uniref:hybrid sensor histidine kinase/response regulator n=1 Tax=Pseudoduganella lutea TaxID=321985 RepID=UPI001E349262|nr:ATP-binding protein [Pseudoduganella lutea]
MENRVLIYAPIGKDGRLIAQLLHRGGVGQHVCTTSAQVVTELTNGAGALLLTDEALDSSLLRSLNHFIQQQPAWSDLPILLMVHSARANDESSGLYDKLGYVSLLERPLQGATILSAVKSALRARERQYMMREIDRRKDEFLAMLAHELRNPLAPVSAASDLLKLGNLSSEKIKQTSEVISRQVRHMTGLIDDLLDVSRVSRGLVNLDSAAVDARQVISGALEQARSFIDAKRHQLILRTSPEHACIQGDHKRLVQILANILNNAAKYTPEGGEISLSMDVDNSEVTFTVSDNGIGIANDVIEHVFEMFAQAERSADRAQGGLGIGLALVKNLVHLHRGRVTVHSDGIGAGSSFKVILPRCAEINHPLVELIVQPQQPTRSPKILVVDDNKDAADMLGLFLEAAGYDVKVVHSATAALSMVAKGNVFDACLLDIGLPDMDGNALATRLRELAPTAESFLIAITGYGQDSDRARTREAGFDEHHVKPVNMDNLLRSLAALP